MFSQVQPTVTAEQVRQAFKALGALEGLAGPSRDVTGLGDTIAQILHAAAREANRRERRLDAAQAARRARRLARRGELVLLPDNVVTAIFGDEYAPVA